MDFWDRFRKSYWYKLADVSLFHRRGEVTAKDAWTLTDNIHENNKIRALQVKMMWRWTVWNPLTVFIGTKYSSFFPYSNKDNPIPIPTKLFMWLIKMIIPVIFMFTFSCAFSKYSVFRCRLSPQNMEKWNSWRFFWCQHPHGLKEYE